MNKILLSVGLLALLAFALRVFRLDFLSLRGDEAFTVVFVQRTWDGLWRGLRLHEQNPPLMYLALRGWVALAGQTEFAARFFSVFFGVLGVPLLYRLAREIFGNATRDARARTSALCAAALIAINPYQIWHSQDVRNYSLWPALSLLALIFFWRWWRNEQTADDRPQTAEKSANYQLLITNLIFYTLAAAAAIYSHYFETFVVIALNAFVFFTLWGKWRAWARWAIAQIVLIAAYAPWLLAAERLTHYNEGHAQKSLSVFDIFGQTLAAFTFGDTAPAELKLLWLPLAGALAAILVYHARAARQPALFMLLYFGAPTLILYLISIGRPLFLERYLNGIAPAYYLIFGAGLALLWTWRARARAFVIAFALGAIFFGASAAVALGNYYFDPAHAKTPDWRALGTFIAARQQTGDILVENYTEMSPVYYRESHLPVITLPKDYFATPDDDARLRALYRDYRRIWFLPAPPDWWDPDRAMERLLTRSADLDLEAQIAGLRVQLYLTPREFESKIIPLNARIGNATLVGYRLRGMEPGARQIPGASTLNVVLYWKRADKIEKDYTVFVHLAGADERVAAQRDGAPARGTFPTSQWRADEWIVDQSELRVDAPAGAYRLLVGMYDAATLARVPAFDAQGMRAAEDRVLITTLELTR